MSGYRNPMMGGFQNRGMAAPAPPPQQEIDFNSFDNETIKQHLQTRGLATNGDRQTLINRLKEEVNKAWSHYYSRNNTPTQYGGVNRMQGGFNNQYNQGFNNNQQPQPEGQGGQFNDQPKKKRRRKRKRSTMTDEERTKLEDERKVAKEAKEARKAENKKKELDAREKKRLKREAAAMRQAEMEQKQKQQKEKRQRSEVFVYFDMKAFSEQLMTALDPDGNRVNACNYDFSHKGFRVRFTDPDYASKCAHGATMSNPRAIQVPTNLQVLPAPIESHCVFFLDPCHAGHPEKVRAFAWVAEQGIETKTSDIKTLNLWKDSAVSSFSRFGNIVNVYRERGFIVIQYQTEQAAESMFDSLNENETLNAISLLFMKRGTPKKRDRIECDKKYPKLAKLKDKKPKAETENEDGDEEVKVQENSGETTVVETNTETKKEVAEEVE